MMNGSPTSPEAPRIPARRLMEIRLRRRLPLLVWLGVALIAVPLYLRQERSLAVTGFAVEVRYDVSCETAGRLQRLEVKPNQDVAQGQIVASFENRQLLLELQEARAEQEKLAGELDRERALRELDAAGELVDQRTNLRRFASDAANAHIEYLAALTELAEDRIDLQGLELTLNRTSLLGDSDLVSAATLEADRIGYEALAAKIQGQESTVTELLTAFHAAEARYREFMDEYMTDPPDLALLLQPLQSAIEAQETRIEMVNLAIDKSVLRAPVDGRVAEILRRPGEIVAAGDPVLSILEPLSTQLVTYLPERRIRDLQPGDEVRLSRIADPGRTFVSSVASLGSSVEQSPLRLDPANTIPSWGLAVFIPLPVSLAAIPGEAFAVSFP